VDLICGINPVLEALQASSRHFDRLLIVKGIRNRRISEAISRASELSVPLRFESRETLDRLAGGVNHQGIIAVVSALPVLGLERLLDHTRDPALLVVLDGVEDPRNLGAILRTAETAGADGVLIPERRSAGLSEAVGRASAGALEHVRVARTGNLVQCLETLKARGIWVIGFDAEAGERWDTIDYKGPVALVFGGEGRGMRRLVRERCDLLATLPLFGHVSSLNVSVAAGVALYEVIRQRGLTPSQLRPIPIGPPPAPAAEIVGPAPDDPERDPGAGLAGSSPAGDQPPADAAEDRHPSVLIDDQDVAWATTPAIKVIGAGRRRGRARAAGRGSQRRARKRSRAPGPQQATPERPPGNANATESVAGAREGGRRRSRPRKASEKPAQRPGGAVASGSDGAATSAKKSRGSSRKRRRRGGHR